MSPMTAPRPWPTCIGPVGLALTNSIIVFCCLPASLLPKRPRSSSIARAALCHTSGASVRLRKPGPAISTFDNSFCGSDSLSTMACASERGLGFCKPAAAACCFCRTIAALQA